MGASYRRIIPTLDYSVMDYSYDNGYLIKFSKGFELSINSNNLGKLSLPALLLLGLYRLYKIFLSPLIGNQCRYLPTCSDYAADCVRKHGAWRGAWMGFARVCRCHPKGGHGYDPAPEIAPKAEWYKPWDYGDWDNRFRPTNTNILETEIK